MSLLKIVDDELAKCSPVLSTTDTFKLCDRGVDWLVVRLEGGMFTGFVKIHSLSDNARSAIILKRGRMITAVYDSHVDHTVRPHMQGY